jgi:hypothetical protein
MSESKVPPLPIVGRPQVFVHKSLDWGPHISIIMEELAYNKWVANYESLASYVQQLETLNTALLDKLERVSKTINTLAALNTLIDKTPLTSSNLGP